MRRDESRIMVGTGVRMKIFSESAADVARAFHSSRLAGNELSSGD